MSRQAAGEGQGEDRAQDIFCQRAHLFAGAYSLLFPPCCHCFPSVPQSTCIHFLTFLQWFNAGSVLGSLSVAMLHLPGKSYIGGLLFLPVGVSIMLYALSSYQLRLRLLRRRRMEGYHDAWGPTVLTVCHGLH
jgi:hypothetical protein